MSKTTPLTEAKAAAERKKAELDLAEKDVTRIRAELGECHKAIRAAQEAEDEKLPQCVSVVKAWRGGEIRESIRCVILRQTPTGRLVVRRFGDATWGESRFKLSKHAGVFVEDVKHSSIIGDSRELRNVPAEFMPKA
jgi:hypothetical protein